MSRRTIIHVPENRLFHDAWNSSAVGLRGALSQLQRLLPHGWVATEGPRTSVRQLSLIVRAPDGATGHLRVLSRHRFEPRDVADAIASPGIAPWSRWPLLVAAPFLSDRTRLLLTSGGANYADATGNLRLTLPRPAILIERRGASRDPAQRKRGLRSLRGAAARRVVEALCDVTPPCGVRAFARRTNIPVATVSRVFNLLAVEAVLTLSSDHQVMEIDRETLVSRRDDE
jgi:hypothetical protein